MFGVKQGFEVDSALAAASFMLASVALDPTVPVFASFLDFAFIFLINYADTFVEILKQKCSMERWVCWLTDYARTEEMYRRWTQFKTQVENSSVLPFYAALLFFIEKFVTPVGFW